MQGDGDAEMAEAEVRVDGINETCTQPLFLFIVQGGGDAEMAEAEVSSESDHEEPAEPAGGAASGRCSHTA